MQNLSLQKQRVNDWMREKGARFAVVRQGQRQVADAPYDPIPRVLSGKTFTYLEQGLIQRINALNLFLNDIYHDRMILQDGIIPEEFVYASPDFLRQCIGITPPKSIYTHITATDLFCDKRGQWYAMEDSLSVPDGPTYPHFARKLCREVSPDSFSDPRLCDNCGLDILLEQLYRDIREGAPDLEDGLVVVLSEGDDSISSFELHYMAGLTGAAVAQPSQLIVMDGKVYYRAPEGGFQKVSIIHRLTLDNMLDPLCFDENSIWGIPHLMEVYSSGKIAIINAPGCSVAEDRGLGCFIPAMIRYYLDEEPILKNVPTYLPWYEDQREYALAHMEKLIFKDVSSDRRVGAIYGRDLDEEARGKLRQRILANPRRYIAQEIMEVEELPVLRSDGVNTKPARCDFRAYTVHSDSIRVWMGGLSRYTVVTSAGKPISGFKDTWVMSE
ncbi:MAG: circularly permuted type 2 ATP-grasp protein [Oscillospiraceae bacterium]|nr:circularly permuted type 2 ATP-grasp protein [Oscillospiraceae bacterium]